MLACFGVLLFFFATPVAFAADFNVTPAVIDGKGKIREILRYTIMVKNESGRLISIYPWVTDVAVDVGNIDASDLGGGSPGEDRDNSLSRWIEVTRGVIDLKPGESREVPVLIQVNVTARPGIYHSLIRFSQGTTRVEAEANEDGTKDVAVNIEVLDDIHERLQLISFKPEENIVSGESAAFTYSIENIGNRGLVPKGKIRIYDRRGSEVASVDVNEQGDRIDPTQKEQLASAWAAGGHFGRYKALLELEYGSKGLLQDTVFFWVMPWKKLIGFFGTIIMLAVITVLVMHSYGASRRRIPELEPQLVAPVHSRGIRREFETYDDAPEYTEEPGWFRRNFIDRFRGVQDGEGGRHHPGVSEFHEVEIPERTRTYPSYGRGSSEARIMREERPTLHRTPRHVRSVHEAINIDPRKVTPAHEEHKVRLSQRPKPKPDPRHIVSLKKMR
jgi:hypothetical protein